RHTRSTRDWSSDVCSSDLLGNRGDVPELLAACDVFALTSISEAASMTILEAMRAARPVVVTDVGGNRELVTPGQTGLLVPAGDEIGRASCRGRGEMWGLCV